MRNHFNFKSRLFGEYMSLRQKESKINKSITPVYFDLNVWQQNVKVGDDVRLRTLKELRTDPKVTELHGNLRNSDGNLINSGLDTVKDKIFTIKHIDVNDVKFSGLDCDCSDSMKLGEDTDGENLCVNSITLEMLRPVNDE